MAIDFSAIRAERVKWAAQETKGERFAVPRENMDPVDVILYRPEKSEGRLPVLFNMHGGAWIGGDAVLMESFCQLLADEIPAFVVNVNYKKSDVHPFPYALTEVADAVKYFAAHADEYGIDAGKMAVGGHSAGAQIAAGAAMKLKEDGVKLAAQMLVYPCTDMTPEGEEGLMAMIQPLMFPNGDYKHRWASPALASDEALTGLCPAIFIECGLDELKPMGIRYAKRLIGAAVPVKVKEYPKALHGFLEVNRPEYNPADPRVTPEQAEYARDCEKYLINELRACFAEA